MKIITNCHYPNMTSNSNISSITNLHTYLVVTKENITYLFIYLFIYGSINDTTTSTDYDVSEGRMIRK